MKKSMLTSHQPLLPTHQHISNYPTTKISTFHPVPQTHIWPTYHYELTSLLPQTQHIHMNSHFKTNFLNHERQPQ